jgi:hypothetical protein
MDEGGWLVCDEPQTMLEFLRGKARGRKLRLFAGACCRRIWHLLAEGPGRRVVEMAERFADGRTTHEELLSAARAAARVVWEMADSDFDNTVTLASCSATSAACHTAVGQAIGLEMAASGAAYACVHASDECMPAREDTRRKEGQHQAELLRDIFGPLLFRPVAVSPAWLAWNEGTVVRLAQVAYQERHLPAGTLDNARLAVLADALEEAGCTDAEILGHLRGAGPHVRGCWVVDCLLGKE